MQDIYYKLRLDMISGELCRRLNTDRETGLTPEQAAEILAKTGPNTLTPSTKTPEIVKFIRTLTQGE
jgi:magnesium-transporting ATPase (P-type)